MRVLDRQGTSMKEEKRSIFSELRDNPNLPTSEKSAKRLEDEATLLVMAGRFW